MRWVLLRGLSREAGHWGAFPQQLAQALGLAPGQLQTPDLPGAGRLHRQPSPWRVAAMVDGVRQQVGQAPQQGGPAPQQVGTVPQQVLVGLSLGGMVASAWAARHPQEVAGLVLINSSLRRFSPPWQRLQPAALARLPALAVAWARQDTAALERAVLGLTSAQPPAHQAELADWQALRQRRPVTLANTLRQLAAAAAEPGPAHAPVPAVLVLSSAGDRLVSPGCSARLAQAWRAEHRVHPWAGHDLPLDDGTWMVQQLADWAAVKDFAQPA